MIRTTMNPLMQPVGAAMAAMAFAARFIAAMAAPTGLVLLWLAGAAPVQAQERILSYDSVIEVHADGSLDIVEDIRVRAEGRAIRRGIYRDFRSEEHTSELQSLMRISYAVFCLKKKKT